MGYYTDYRLTVDGSKSEKHEKAISEKYRDGVPFSQEDKWYSWEKDMTEYSKLHPGSNFILKGRGEDFDDNWKSKFKNGKHQCLK